MNISVDDIVSIIFAIIALVYTVASVLKAIYGPKKQPEPWDDMEEEEPEKDKPVKRAPAAPPPVVTRQSAPKRPLEEKYAFHAQMDDFQQKTNIDERHLDIHLRPGDELVSESLRLMAGEGTVGKKRKKVPIQNLIASLPQEKLILVSYEVFHKPVALRETPFPWNG